jgi:hypothetical protein
LSVKKYVGAAPNRRNIVSMQASAVGNVLSQVGITTRNRDHANHAQNRHVGRPHTTGAVPQSYWAHIPGSGTHGR